MTNGVQLTQEEKTFGMLAHLTALFFGFVGPLIIWLIKKDESAWVEKQGKESLNFQISIAIYLIVSSILIFIIIGIILVFAVLIFDLVMIIMATIKTNNGEDFSYPLCIRFIK